MGIRDQGIGIRDWGSGLGAGIRMVALLAAGFDPAAPLVVGVERAGDEDDDGNGEEELHKGRDQRLEIGDQGSGKA